MKKTLLITLSMLMGLMFAFSISAHAATMTVDDIKYYYVEGEDTCTVSTYASGITEAVIPDSVNGKTVVGINKDAFKNCTTLTSADISPNVQSIGNYAFQGCKLLETVIIPDSVTVLGSNSFSGCSGLKGVTLSLFFQR